MKTILVATVSFIAAVVFITYLVKLSKKAYLDNKVSEGICQEIYQHQGESIRRCNLSSDICFIYSNSGMPSAGISCRRQN